jgi:hypothetical protein
MMDLKWFSNDPAGNGLELHGSMSKASEAAEAAYDVETSSDGGCADDLKQICWGLVFVSFDKDGPKNDVDDMGDGYSLAGQFAAEADALRARVAELEAEASAPIDEARLRERNGGYLPLGRGVALVVNDSETPKSCDKEADMRGEEVPRG